MFVCEQCGKSYLSQYALSRHTQNHNGGQYTCSVCLVTYSRRDLLARHGKIHKAHDTAGRASDTSSRIDDAAQDASAGGPDPLSPTRHHQHNGHGSTGRPSDSPPPSRSRRRRHTACTHCAEQRKKCRGGDPCTTCERAGYKCVFPTTRARISRAPVIQEGTIIPEGTIVQAGTVVSESIVIQDGTVIDPRRKDNSSAATARIRHISQTAGNIDYASAPRWDDPSKASSLLGWRPPETLSTQPDDLEQLLELPLEHELSLYATNQSASTFAPDVFDLDSWVWLHEDLYLQPNDGLLNSSETVADQILGPTIPHTDLLSQNPQSTQPLPVQSIVHSDDDGPRGYPGDTTPENRRQLIDKLVSYAAVLNLPAPPRAHHGDYWVSMSDQIRTTFCIELNTSQHILQGFIDLYLQHFWPLWPLLAHHRFSADELHPLLYLVLASVGAMYGDSGSVRFGCLLHNKVRTCLTVAFELDDGVSDFTWLAQARLYTQVAALYFGQPKAFTYAQHLGALLVAQARRTELFSADRNARAYHNFTALRNKDQSSKRLELWLQLETRRRLAFGIFRVDTYTSILMDTRPLLSLDEIDLSFPYCDAVWRATDMPIDACLYMIDHDRTPSRHLRASDIYGIALDPDEMLPTLDPVAHELLLFGLQRSLGRFAFEHSALARLADCHSQNSGTHADAQTSEISSLAPLPRSRESTQLSSTQRRMRRLRREFESMSQAQKKWEDALPVVKTFAVETSDRSSLMSGLVLFHLGFLRLNAPISKLHQLQYRLAEGSTIDPSLLTSIATWLSSPGARLAAHRSCDLFGLVASEAGQEAPDGIKFNLLAFIALHHASIIVWCYAMACDGGYMSESLVSHAIPSPGTPLTTEILYLSGHSNNMSIEVRRYNVKAITDAFVDLFNCISPGNWSSFAEAAGSLARLEFPGIPVEAVSANP